jgi:microcystin-dependent protein
MMPTPFIHAGPVGSVTSFAGYVNTSAGNDPVPAGFGINPEPWGWMVCDGRELKCSDYPELFMMIGLLYSQQGDRYMPGQEGQVQNDMNVTFRIPDYRGYFLRMVSGDGQWPGGQNPDPDAYNRVMTNGQHSQGIGSIQRDALQNHRHSYQQGTPQAQGSMQGGPPVLSATQNAFTSDPETSSNPVNLSQETRPKNIYVYYLIKYTS